MPHDQPEDTLASAVDIVRDTQSQAHVVIPATDQDVRSGLATLKSLAILRALDPDLLGSVELVIAEILNNVVEHAYRGISDGHIDVAVSQNDRTLEFNITDCGHNMPDGKLPCGALVELTGNLADLPEGGFGWFLIRELTHDLEYSVVDRCNKLSFKIALEPSAG